MFAINHDLQGILWCGPGAIAALTGLPTSTIVALTKADRGSNRPVKGMFNIEMVSVLAAAGFEAVHLHHWQGHDVAAGSKISKKATRLPTLRQCARELQAQAGDLPILVKVTGHYIVVEKGWTIDNQRRDAAVRINDSRHARKRVVAAWAVRKVSDAAVVIPSDPEQPKKPYKSAQRKAREQAKALAAQHGISVVRSTDRWLTVWPPASLDGKELDPYYGNHGVQDWPDALPMVQEYVRLLTKGGVA